MSKIYSNILYNSINETLKNFDLDKNNPVSIISDNASYNKKMIKDYFPSIPNISCLSHILNLVSKEILDKNEFHSLELYNQFYQLFYAKRTNLHIFIQKEFKREFGISSKSLFFIENIKWSSLIYGILFLDENYLKMKIFLQNLSVKHEDIDKTIEIIDNLSFKTEIHILSQIIKPLEKSLKISQRNKILDVSDDFNFIDSFIKTLENFINYENSKLLVKDIYQKNNIFEEPDKLISYIINVCSRAVKKYKKHSETTSNVIKAINCFSKFPFSKEFPTSVIKFSKSGFFSLMNEWNNIKLLKEKEVFDTKNFWISMKEEYKELSKLVLRLLTIEAGISNIERKFSLWRYFQNKQRLNLKDENLEKLLFIRFNSEFFDHYK